MLNEAFRGLQLSTNDTTPVHDASGLVIESTPVVVVMNGVNTAQFLARKELRIRWGLTIHDVFSFYHTLLGQFVKENNGIILGRRADHLIRDHENSHALVDCINPEMLNFRASLAQRAYGERPLPPVVPAFVKLKGMDLTSITDEEWARLSAYNRLHEGVSEWIAYEAKRKLEAPSVAVYKYHHDVYRAQARGLVRCGGLSYELGYCFVNDVLDGLQRDGGLTTAEALRLIINNPPANPDTFHQGMYYYKGLL
jgi:hypothetical protein